jgi:hypothetical protein
MTLSNEQQLRTEGNKLLHETMKQLVTISSGSILILIAFWEKIFKEPFKEPLWKPLVAVAFVGFLICIIAAVVMMRTISLNVGAGYTKSYQYIERPARRIAYVSFLLGIAALVVFVIRNLRLGY